MSDIVDSAFVIRTTAATRKNDLSSRSHAVFTIRFTQVSTKRLSVCVGGGALRGTVSEVDTFGFLPFCLSMKLAAFLVAADGG